MKLTPRQREVLKLRAEGLSVKECASTMRVSPKTVEFHLALVQARLGFRDIALLTQWALKHRVARYVVPILLLCVAGCATQTATPPKPQLAIAPIVEAPEAQAQPAIAPAQDRVFPLTYAPGFTFYDILTATNPSGPWTVVLKNCYGPASGDLAVTNNEPLRFWATFGHNDYRP